MGSLVGVALLAVFSRFITSAFDRAVRARQTDAGSFGCRTSFNQWQSAKHHDGN
jgi:hypothetical protein